MFFCLPPELCVRSHKVALEASLSSFLLLQKQVKQWVPAVHCSHYLNSHHAMVNHLPAAVFLLNLLSRDRMMQNTVPRDGGRWAAPGLEKLRKLFPKLHFSQRLPQDCIGLFWGGIFRSGKGNYTALNKSEVRRGQSLAWQGFNLLGVFLQNYTDSFFKIKLLKIRWIGT